MRRTFALLQAAWLAMLIAEPASLHPCPMHATGHGSHAAPATMPAEAHEAHSHHAAHAAVPAADEAAAPLAVAATDSEQGATPHCQCLGQCCVAAAHALTARVSIADASIVTVAVHAPATSARIASRAADLHLPFANAPPAVLTA